MELRNHVRRPADGGTSMTSTIFSVDAMLTGAHYGIGRRTISA